MEYFLYPFQIAIQNYFQLSQTDEETGKNNKEKRGRKSLNSTIILSEFFGKNRKDPPRREYIRCCLFRKMFKFIRSIRKNKVESSTMLFYKELLEVISENYKEIKKLTAKENLPYVENKTNKKYRSYNNKFCKEFLKNDLIKKVFCLFVEYLFTNFSLEELSKKLGIYCCKDTCQDELSCRIRFEKIKYLILLDILS